MCLKQDINMRVWTTEMTHVKTLNLAGLRAAIDNVVLEKDQRQANAFVSPHFQEDYALAPVQQPIIMAAARTFLLDTFRGNINPDETNRRKLYLSATKEKDDNKKFTVCSDTAKAVMEAMVDNAN